MDPIYLPTARMSFSRPLAVIIRDNPTYTQKPTIRMLATRFYGEIRLLLLEKGYRVEFDQGEPKTLPDLNAKVWIGHSRGVDRLRLAPSHITTLALQTRDHGLHFSNAREQGMHPRHYELSEQDLAALNAL